MVMLWAADAATKPSVHPYDSKMKMLLVCVVRPAVRREASLSYRQDDVSRE